MKGRYRKKFSGIILFAMLTLAGSSLYASEVQEDRTRQEVSAEAAAQGMVLPGGMPAGIYLETEGVLVLGTDKIPSAEGEIKSPAENIVRTGDYIVGINQDEIQSKKELVRYVEKLDGREIVLHLKRAGEKVDVRMKPVESAPRNYRLGIWVRDNTQGLGTVTFLTGDGKFGALGHGIHDSDTGQLFEIAGGTLYETSIRGIQKGKSGVPGGMEGVIVYSIRNRLGKIEKNTDEGIYGVLEKKDDLFQNVTPIPVGAQEEVVEGPASIRCMVDGTVRDYDIEITQINTRAREVNKGIVLKVTDRELLSMTGGIVQGMGVIDNRDNTRNPVFMQCH